jgi:hypothetical protein
MTRSRLVVSFAAVVVGIGATIGLGAWFLGSASAAVGPLPGEALLLPADARFVGGIDVKRFTASPFYSRYASPAAKGRPETFRELEEKTGLNPERDIEQIIFAGTPRSGRETGVVVALGRFDRAKISSAIESEKKVTSKSVQGLTVYLFAEGQKGAGAVSFVDNRTLVMGSQAAVEAAILSQSQGGRSLKQNQTIMALLERVRPDATFWAVGDQSVLENMPRSVPAPGGQGGQLTLPGLRSISVSGDMEPMIAVEITGEANDESAAKNLADVVRGFVALAALQANQRPELKELASAVSVTTEAKQVKVNARVPYELIDLLQKPAERRQPGAEPDPR